TGRANGAADDRAGRPGNHSAERRTGDAAGQPAGAGAGLVVALGRLAADRADRAADDRPDGSTDGHPDAGPAQGADTGADGLLAAFVVLGRGAVAVDGGPGDVRLADRGAVVGLHHVAVPLLVMNVARLTVAGIHLVVLSHQASP